MISLLAGIALGGVVPAVERGPVGRAVVIGVGSYSDPSLVDGAVNAPADAHAVAQLFRGEGDRFAVTELTDLVTEGELRAALTAAAEDLGEQDSLVVYYAGHALSVRDPDAPGGWDLALLASPATAADPLSSAVRLRDLYQTWSTTEAAAGHPPRNLLLIVDACRDALAPPLTAPPSVLTTWGHPGLWAVVFATEPMDVAAEDARHGVFTGALLTGATPDATGFSPADADHSGAVTAVEWILFALGATAVRTADNQRPQALVDARGRERFLLFGSERSAETAFVYGSSGSLAVGGDRGLSLAVDPGVVRVSVAPGAGRPLATWVRLRPGEEFSVDPLADAPARGLYAGGALATAASNLSSPLAVALVADWIPDRLGRTSLGARAAWGLGAVEGPYLPNTELLGRVGRGWSVISAGPRGLDRVDVGPLLGAGALARWPEAIPHSGVPTWQSHAQVGALAALSLAGHLCLGALRLGFEAGARAPYVDGHWEVEPAFALATTTRLARRSTP